MVYDIGLKLYSTNIESQEAAAELYKQGVLDYIELMVIPGSYKQTIASWKGLDVPFELHAPHSEYGFNLSDYSLRRQNQKTFREVCSFADDLSVHNIVVHPGLCGEAEETIGQIRMLKDKRFLIENLPFVSLMGTRCIGSSPKEIKMITKATGVGFCLDIPHAFKAAFSYGQDNYQYLTDFMRLKPRMVHLCGIRSNGYFDEHLSLAEGDLKLSKLVQFMRRKLENIRLTLETPESNYKKLLGFRINTKRIKGLFETASKR